MLHKLGIIGYGNMGSWHCENVRKRIEGLDVCAVYDIAPERREKARENGFTVYESLEDFFESDIDIVTIATPNNFHKYYSILAMENRKNVVCEKPVCMNSEELEKVLQVCEETKMKFTVHQNRRWDRDFAVMKNIMKSKMVGNPYFLDSRLYSNHGISGGWRSSYVAGGGVLYDWGVHMLDQILQLVDSEPVSVYAQLKNISFKSVDDTIKVMVEFENGLSASVTADLWCHLNEPRWHLCGDAGTVQIDRWFKTEGKIIKADIKTVTIQEGCVYTPNGLTKTMWPRPECELEELPLPVPAEDPRWEEFYENFMAAIEGKEEQIVTHPQMRKVMKVLDAAFESAKNNKAVKL